MNDYELEEKSYLSNILQREVNKLNKIMYKNDTCKPKFRVSINCDKSKKYAPELYLICEHCGMSVNRKMNLFPFDENSTWYSEFNLKKFMEYLYNCTM